MTKNMNFSVIIPAYLEEENLQIILPELQEEIAKITKEYEVLVIDTMIILKTFVQSMALSI